MVGADAGELAVAAAQLRAAAAELDGHASTLTANLGSVAWIGGVSVRFLGHWNGTHRPHMNGTATYLRDAAAQLDRNAAEQLAASGAGDAAAGPGSVLGGLTGAGFADGPGGGSFWDDGDGILDEIVEFLTGDIGNVWHGGDDGLPIGQLAAALVRVARTRAFLLGGLADELFPVFNTGRVGVALAGALEGIPGLAGIGRWLGTPGATTAFRAVGVVGGVISTGAGLYTLYQPGNPVDAFQRDGAGYVADVAGTAFSASTTAFLIAPNPVTGALVIGTGVVWAGAEIVDHWDDITEWSSDAWDAGTDFVGDAWDAGADRVGDAWDAGTDFIGGIGSGATDFVGGLFG
jgi:hypothetical protein